jgi:hypothetical protein
MALTPGGQRNPAVDDARRQQSYDLIARFSNEELAKKYEAKNWPAAATR